MANANDFLENLGKTLSETAKTVGEKTDEFIAIQKLKSQQSTLENEVKKNYKDIGEMVFHRFVNGDAYPEEISEICQEVMKIQNDIAECKETIANKKGLSVCPACGANVPKESTFCMKCGAQMPEPEEEPEEAEFTEAEDETDAAEDAADAACEAADTMKDAACDAADTVKDAATDAVENMTDAATAAADAVKDAAATAEEKE